MEQEFLLHGIGIQPTEEKPDSVGVRAFTRSVRQLFETFSMRSTAVRHCHIDANHSLIPAPVSLTLNAAGHGRRSSG
jgi:hypothetical protein